MIKRNAFHRLLASYERPVELVGNEEGQYVDGEYVAGVAVTESWAAVVTPISERKAYDSGGSYTTQDKQLTAISPVDLARFSQVRIYGQIYDLELDGSYDMYVDAYNYIAKRVDSFDQSKSNDAHADNGAEKRHRL